MKSRARILIAEAVPDIRELFRIILDPVTDCIDFAGDNQEALAKIGMACYDLVFLDVGVPELDGLECAEILNQRHPVLPVVVSCSIKLPTRLAAHFLSHPTNFLVRKPFDIKEMREIVLHVCQRSVLRARRRSMSPRRHADTLAEAV